MKSTHFGAALFILALIVGFVMGGVLPWMDGSNPVQNEPSFGLGFWLTASGIAFLYSFGLHLLLRKKKMSMEKSGRILEDERMLEPFYGAKISERIGFVVSVALLGSLPVLIIFLVFSDLQPPWRSSFTAAAGFLALMIFSVYSIILFRKSREFYDRHELIIVPTLTYLFSMLIYKYALSFEFLSLPSGISAGDLLIVIYSMLAIPAGVKLILTANRTIFDKKARAEDELKFASEIQQQFLSDRYVNTDVVSGFGTSMAAREVGGDFLYLDSLENRSVVAAVGDVSGHSFGAGLIMSMLITMTEDYLQFRQSPEGLMENLNRKLRNQPKRNLFATMGCIRLDGDTATIWNAGHMPVLTYSSEDDEIKKIKPPGFALGMTKKAECSPAEISLERGEFLILYSDGLVETRDEHGEIRGEEDFYANVYKAFEKETGCKEIAQNILENTLADDYSDYPEDDLTIVVLKRD